MKPSERIQEMYDILRESGDTSEQAIVNAIINYLDEIHCSMDTKNIFDTIILCNKK